MSALIMIFRPMRLFVKARVRFFVQSFTSYTASDSVLSLGITETFARCVSSSQRSERWRLLYRTRSNLQGKEALLIWPTAYVKGVVESWRRGKVKEGNLSRFVSFPPYSLKIELFIYGTFSRPIGANARGFKSRAISLQWMRIQSLCTL